MNIILVIKYINLQLYKANIYVFTTYLFTIWYAACVFVILLLPDDSYHM
jgi:hypothetical protein